MCVCCTFVSYYVFLLHRIRHTEKANESNAIETLMVTDELFRFAILLSWEICSSKCTICVPDQLMFQLDRDMWP